MVKGLKNKNWISLKEASEISGYTPDYLGQLIRKGKLPGKQVVSRIAWLTIKEAILEYKKKEKETREKKRKITPKEKFFESLNDVKERFLSEIRLLSLFFRTFKHLLIIIFVLIISFSVMLFYVIFSASIKNQKTIPVCGEIKLEKETELQY